MSEGKGNLNVQIKKKYKQLNPLSYNKKNNGDFYIIHPYQYYLFLNLCNTCFL